MGAVVVSLVRIWSLVMWVVLLRPVLGSRRFSWRVFLRLFVVRYRSVLFLGMVFLGCLLVVCTTYLLDR
jgi:hypothetical protein